MKRNTIAAKLRPPGARFSPGPTALCVLLLMAIVLAACGVNRATPTEGVKSPPSAIGNEVVNWIVVSPAYAKTGLVLATSTRASLCAEGLQACYNRLWISHDGGANWRRSKTVVNVDQPVIAVDSSGHETLFSMGDRDLRRSDDGGDTWLSAGPRGFPTPLPSYESDSMVAVAASSTNYLLNAATGVTQTVTGSGGVLDDMAFAFSPGFPDSGSFPPAWLVGFNKENRRPIVQQCNAQLACVGSSIFPGTVKNALIPTFYPSSEYSKDGVVFVQADRFMQKSTDGGVTFRAPRIVDDASTKSNVWMISVDRRYAEAGPVRSVYAAYTEKFTETLPGGGQTAYTAGGLYRTTDGGRSWGKVGSSEFDKGATAINIAPDGRFFAAFLEGTIGWDGGLLCSTDGKEWKASCPPVGAST